MTTDMTFSSPPSAADPAYAGLPFKSEFTLSAGSCLEVMRVGARRSEDLEHRS